MDKKDEIGLKKKTKTKHKRQVMDREKEGEPKSGKVKSGEKMNCPGDKQLKSSDSEKRSSGGTKRETEEIRTGERGGDGERKTKPKKRRMKEKGVGVSSDEGRPGEKRGRTGSGDEDRQDVRESQGVEKSRGQGSRKNVRGWSVSYSSTVDQTGGDKTIMQETLRPCPPQLFGSRREVQCGQRGDIFLQPGAWITGLGSAKWLSLVAGDGRERSRHWRIFGILESVCSHPKPVTRAWLVCSRVRGYADLSEEQVLNEADKALKDSMHMAKEALKLSLKERLEKFGFFSRYVSDRESSEDSDIAEMLDLFFGKTENDDSDERERARKRTGRAKDDDKAGGEGDKKKRMKKKEGEEGLTYSVPVKRATEKMKPGAEEEEEDREAGEERERMMRMMRMMRMDEWMPLT